MIDDTVTTFKFEDFNIPVVNQMVKTETLKGVKDTCRNDYLRECFSQMRQYLQAYTVLAYAGQCLPDQYVDELFDYSIILAEKAVIALDYRVSYFMHHEDIIDIDNMRKELYLESEELVLEGRKIVKMYHNAKSRLDKVIAIDSLVHIFHHSGCLLPELFDFPVNMKPIVDYTLEVLDMLENR
jgi:hypothetical protein